MKVSLITLTTLALLLSQHATNAFVTPTSQSSSSLTAMREASALAAAGVELVVEPEGGDEMTSVQTMPGSRMKNMGEVDGVKDEGGTVYKFWLTAKANGSLIKEFNTQILKDSAKKANFPGFRKGQIPPYAMPQIRTFAVQEGLITTVKSAVEAYGLKSIAGSNGEVTILEDVAETAKSYKVGDDVEFTATLQAILDPENQPAAAPASDTAADDDDDDDTVIDAEVVEEVEEEA